jgi:hypothetical protein
MANVLIVSTWDYPSFRLTCRAFKALQEVGGFLIREVLSKDITKKDISWCDILLIVRGDDSLSYFLAKTCKKLGKHVILTIDDDLLAISIEGQPKSLVKENHKALDGILKIVSRIIVPSPYLGKKYGMKYDLKYSILGTILKDSDYIEHPKDIDSELIKIVYPAHPGHSMFFNKYISPIIEDLYQRYTGRFSFTFIGPEVILTNPNIPVEYISSMPFVEYERYMKEHHFHLGIAPLDDTESCRCKYYNKYIEFTKYGIVGIYSDLIPYQYIVQNGQNGYLAVNTKEGWLQSLSAAIDQFEHRALYVKKATAILKEKNSLQTFASSIKEEISELTTFKAPKIYNKNYFLPNMRLFDILLRVRNKGLIFLSNI